MDTRRIVSSALASAVALGLTGLAAEVSAQKTPKEACYGVAKRGQNDCVNLAGTHTCAGQAKMSFDPGEWKYVAVGTCKKLNGKTANEVRSPRSEYPPTKTGS